MNKKWMRSQFSGILRLSHPNRCPIAGDLGLTVPIISQIHLNRNDVYFLFTKVATG
jgi:hypothetical protein